MRLQPFALLVAIGVVATIANLAVYLKAARDRNRSDKVIFNEGTIPEEAELPVKEPVKDTKQPHHHHKHKKNGTAHEEPAAPHHTSHGRQPRHKGHDKGKDADGHPHHDSHKTHHPKAPKDGSGSGGGSPPPGPTHHSSHHRHQHEDGSGGGNTKKREAADTEGAGGHHKGGGHRHPASKAPGGDGDSTQGGGNEDAGGGTPQLGGGGVKKDGGADGVVMEAAEDKKQPAHHHHQHHSNRTHHPTAAAGGEKKHHNAAAPDDSGGKKNRGAKSPRHKPVGLAGINGVGKSVKKKRHMFNNVSIDAEGHRVFSNYSYAAAIALWEKNLSPVLDIEQSSIKFKDIFEQPNFGVRLPTEPEEFRQWLNDPNNVPEDDGGGDDSSNSDACDASDSDFDPTKDAACTRYLANIRNWMSVKAMSSILSTGRTIKFKVFYKHNNISAVMKVSQKKFALEPASEVMAFMTDRLLEFYRVPPTVWVPFPLDFLHAAAAVMGPFYSQWFNTFVSNYSVSNKLEFSNPHLNSIRCLNVSLQIWMNDVHDADETILAPTKDYDKYLKLAKKSPDDPEEKKPSSEDLWNTASGVTKIAISELLSNFVFDFIIGNTDRWFGHNSFVVGGCIDASKNTTEEGGSTDEPSSHVAFYGPVGSRAKARCDPPHDEWQRSKNGLKSIFIDQGSSFYKRDAPKENPFAQDDHHNLCVFGNRTYMAMQRYNVPKEKDKESDDSDVTDAFPFTNALKRKLPRGIFMVANKDLVKGAERRLRTIIHHMDSCITRFTKERVLRFD